jgi:hypothetical protein
VVLPVGIELTEDRPRLGFFRKVTVTPAIGECPVRGTKGNGVRIAPGEADRKNIGQKFRAQPPFFHCSRVSAARKYLIFGKGSAVRSKIALAIAAAALGACTPPKGGDIDPSYVSPVFYQNHTCQQLEQEAAAVSGRVAQASAVQDNALLFGGGNTANELASLKGQLVAIEQASIQKNCGIRFPEQPAKPSSGWFHF